MLPPMCASAIRGFSVNADIRLTLVRPEQEALVPASAPAASTILEASSVGFVPAGTSSYMMRVPMAMPPR